MRFLRPVVFSVVLGGLVATAHAQDIAGSSPRDSMLELKLGGYRPLMHREEGLSGDPYEATFNGESMLLFEVELDRQLYQEVGSFGIGFSAGYAEKYAAATVVTTGTASEEKTALKVYPLRLMGVYRMDYFARTEGIPSVPFAKVGIAYIPWKMTKGDDTETLPNGSDAKGGKWGFNLTTGLSLQLDFLDERMSRDLDSSAGVNHSYLFGEYRYENANNFGGPGLDLSSRLFLFGLGLEF